MGGHVGLPGSHQSKDRIRQRKAGKGRSSGNTMLSQEREEE